MATVGPISLVLPLGDELVGHEVAKGLVRTDDIIHPLPDGTFMDIRYQLYMAARFGYLRS